MYLLWHCQYCKLLPVYMPIHMIHTFNNIVTTLIQIKIHIISTYKQYVIISIDSNQNTVFFIIVVLCYGEIA